MFSVTSFDEINKLLPEKRSIPFEKYFGDMGLDGEREEKRIRLAERFFEELLFLFLYLFEMQRTGVFDWEEIRTEAVEAYKRSAKDHLTEERLDERAEIYADNFVRATRDHIEDPYYFSEDRLVVNAENEAESIYSEEEYFDAVDKGYTHKIWHTMEDEYVRHTHAELDGLMIPINEVFTVGDSLMMYPKDDTYLADASETVNCRCYVEYKTL